MAYSDFTLKKVKAEFQLKTVESVSLFDEVPEAEISSYLAATLARNVQLALSINTEKARSELIIINILVEAKEMLAESISLFSGIDFTVDRERGLSGFCDYILSQSAEQLYLDVPVMAVVEAKNEDIIAGLGQCIAEMYAAKLYNEKENRHLPCIYGAVTTGDEWKFLKLAEDTVFIDKPSYYISSIGKIMGILAHMLKKSQGKIEELEHSSKANA
uniref:hypothetical protein n=1 Tax=Candidatus Electronema sp. TaxID=2698783 RepID=UPI004055E3D5